MTVRRHREKIERTTFDLDETEIKKALERFTKENADIHEGSWTVVVEESYDGSIRATVINEKVLP